MIKVIYLLAFYKYFLTIALEQITAAFIRKVIFPHVESSASVLAGFRVWQGQVCAAPMEL